MADQDQKIQTVDRQLQIAAKNISEIHLRELTRLNDRETLCFFFEDMVVDCTRQLVDEKVLKSLLDLADARLLRQSIDAMFSGQKINSTENRPVMHWAQRMPERLRSDEYQKLSNFSDGVRQQNNIKDVVNLGVGGSDLGPDMVTRGLAGFHDGPKIHYVANIDPHALYDVLQKCDPHSTLFIVTSKSFATVETIVNAGLAKQWLQLNNVDPIGAIVAVTARPLAAAEWGIGLTKIFVFDEAVGGRFSLWSAVGLPVMLAIGSKAFSRLLAGAYAMDIHFNQTHFANNIPVIMALLRVWNRSYLGYSSYGLMPYDQRLERLPAWAQQLEMESNGKAVDRQGRALASPAGPLIWGEAGTSGQHSFIQWLHQSLDVVPIDILVALKSESISDNAVWQASQKTLAISAVAQAEALAIGFNSPKALQFHCPGNRPSVLISWDTTTPYTLGRLLALYEHITIVSGFMWNVNSFDQWGVEHGKAMAIELESNGDLSQFSASAKAFLARVSKV